MMTATDPVTLTRDLIRCASVTPDEGGALVLLEALLTEAGFICTRVDRGKVSNLFARWGDKGHARTLGFNGHTDVVPVGDVDAWRDDPFGGVDRDGWLYGRGSTDMKSGVAAWVAAAIDFVGDLPPDTPLDGAMIIAITGDEEGDAVDGTTAILDWMDAQGEAMTACIVGEPTCPEVLGDMIKIGRRGSMTAWFTVTGVQGHAAYPHRAVNPVPALARLMDRLARHELDQGTAHFDASTLAVTTMDVGNDATNVIPAVARGTVNIRFNDAQSSDGLTDWLRGEADRIAAEAGVTVEMHVKVSGESFVTPPGDLSDMVAKVVTAHTGVVPELSTTGGTSDARFVKHHCPVVEFGLVGKSMHQVDERVEIAQIPALKAIYRGIMQDFFA